MKNHFVLTTFFIVETYFTHGFFPLPYRVYHVYLVSITLILLLKSILEVLSEVYFLPVQNNPLYCGDSVREDTLS